MQSIDTEDMLDGISQSGSVAQHVPENATDVRASEAVANKLLKQRRKSNDTYR